AASGFAARVVVWGTSSPMPIKPADRACRSVFRHLSLPQRSRLVLGADLNCSESRRAAAPPRPESEGGLPPKADPPSAHLERQLWGVSGHSARAGPAPKGGSYYRMPDLRWLCEVVHTWGRNTRGTLPVRGRTIGGDHVRRTRRAALRFLQAWPRHRTQ